MKGTENLVFITGPVASGKSSNAKMFCRHFGCTHFVDGLDAIYEYTIFENKCLVMTSVSDDHLRRLFPAAQVFSFENAKQMAENELILTIAEITEIAEAAWWAGGQEHMPSMGERIDIDAHSIVMRFVNKKYQSL